MPTYTYECEKCGHQFDYFHSITAEPKVVCEKCKGKCHRLIGTGAELFLKVVDFTKQITRKRVITEVVRITRLLLLPMEMENHLRRVKSVAVAKKRLPVPKLRNI